MYCQGPLGGLVKVWPCQADLLIKNDREAKVHLGNSLIPHDPHGKEPGDQLPEPKSTFNFMLSNPPFGVTWGGKNGYEAEARKLQKTRYQAGMPRINDYVQDDEYIPYGEDIAAFLKREIARPIIHWEDSP